MKNFFNLIRFKKTKLSKSDIDMQKLEKLFRHENEAFVWGSTNTLHNFDKVYPTTNENLDLLFKAIDVKDKNVLTVGSSGDQVIYSITNGAKNVVCFDINPFVEHFCNYKIATIKSLDYGEFLRCFQFDMPYFYEKLMFNLLSYRTYSRISHNLPENSKLFWDQYFMEKEMLHNFTLGAPDVTFKTYMYSAEDYKKVKDALMGFKGEIKFITSDVFDIASHLSKKDKFDCVFLSNIIDYQALNRMTRDGKIAGVTRYKNMCDELSEFMTDDGKIQIEYNFECPRTDEKGDYLIDIIFGRDNLQKVHGKYDEGYVIYSPKQKAEKEPNF